MLPYTDTKPIGAADFYFAINATFRFIRSRLGEQGLIKYWTDIGRGYYRPVTRLWQEGGLPAVAAYWRDFFSAEPGSEVTVHEVANAVVLEVKRCPAITHLRNEQRTIEPSFCHHCYFVSEAMAAPSGLTVRVEGGAGACRQTFGPRGSTPPQDLSAIKTCS